MLFPMLVVVLSTVPNLIVLSRAGELLSVEDVVAQQSVTGGFYGTGIHDNTAHYKIALWETQKPEVGVWGSSRALPFREELFSASFVNLGRSIGSIQDAEFLLPKVLSNENLKVLLLSVDYWWLNGAWGEGAPGQSWSNEIPTLDETVKTAFAPLQWLKDGKIGLETYAQFLLDRHPENEFAIPAYGINAILRHNGFRSDGSYYYGGLITSNEHSWDYQFQETRRRITVGDSKFDHFAHIDEAAHSQLKEVVSAFKRKNIAVVAFLPPLAPSVVDFMNKHKDEYAYLDSFKTAVENLGADYYFDFHDVRDLGAGDCEFVDGFHGGEIVYARMLNVMAGGLPDDLKEVFNAQRIRDVVRQYPNMTTTQRLPTQSSEPDFLGLGCKPDPAS